MHPLFDQFELQNGQKQNDDKQDDGQGASGTVLIIHKRLLIDHVDDQIRFVLRPAPRQHVDLPEGLEGVDQGYGNHEKQGGRKQRDRDPSYFVKISGAVDLRAFIQIVVDRLQPAEQNEKGKAEIHPDGRDGYGKEGPFRIGEPTDGIEPEHFQKLIQPADGRMKQKHPKYGPGGDGDAHRGRKDGTEKTDPFHFFIGENRQNQGDENGARNRVQDEKHGGLQTLQKDRRGKDFPEIVQPDKDGGRSGRIGEKKLK